MKNLFLSIVLIFGSGSLFSFTNNSKISFDKEPWIFPVAGKKSNIGSFWGDVREGGKRKHEGIDIFAKRGTPVVAVCDGFISSVGNGGIGGKTIWLQTAGFKTIYYAHLDEQKVKGGEFVRKGEVIGTVGNTGNARTTAPHLHFGIYTWTGAVNPLPYVKNSLKIEISKDAAKTAIAKTSKKFNEKSESTVKVNATKGETKTTRVAENAFPKKYIWKTIDVPVDRNAKYYVTTRSNVVRVQNGKYSVIGKYGRSDNGKYPYRILLANKEELYINSAGKVLNSAGTIFGNIS
jgi:hypothetical protein